MCVANENRSQIAEAVFNKLSKNNAAMSAGLKPNLAGALLRSVRSNFVEVMEEEGYDVSRTKVKRVNRRMADSRWKNSLCLQHEAPEGRPCISSESS